jgi:hypothetical protein
MINNFIMKKYPKGLDEIEWKHVNELINNKFSDYFPFGNKPVEGVKVPMDRFLPPPRRIVYRPLIDTHKNKIKHQILMFHYINQQYPIFTILGDPNDLTKILETRQKN